MTEKIDVWEFILSEGRVNSVIMWHKLQEMYQEIDDELCQEIDDELCQEIDDEFYQEIDDDAYDCR